MSLTAGTRIGPYEISSQIGEGGMGIVFRAHDTKLQRDVALKLLPDHFADDPDRLARFRREAQLLASLNHPNIAQIYGLEESGGARCIVMEFVEGQTLAERIARGPIPVDEALHIAKQIAEALEAAHGKDIIHRDLKPANVKVLADEKVKVLDFGLAKSMEKTNPSAVLSNSPTLASMGATNAGVILGTAAYMSPEQAKGREVDRRADIFAFGCVLYEMLTGRRAFDGEDVTDILGAVLRMEPDWTLLPPGVSPAIRRLLRLCLEKNAKNRRSTATDVRLDIEQALSELATLPAVAPVRSSRLAWMAFAIAALVAAALAVPTVRYLRERTPPSPPETRTDIVTPATSDPISFALSPDGRQLVFVASGDGASRLWLRPLDKATAQPLAGTEGASYPFWSPDSRSIGFFDGTKLKRIDIAGGSPQTLTDATAPRGGTWSPDGIILFGTTGSPLFRIPASGGAPVAVTKKLDKQFGHGFPQFLPGRQFLFYAQGSPETAGIYLGSLDAPEAKRLTAAGASGVYASTGWLLFIRGGTLLAQRLDLTRRELTGDPVAVADPVAFGSSAASAVSVSAAGLVAYRAGGANRRQLTWFDRTGKVLGTVGAADENGLTAPRLSHDGRRVAVWRTVQGNTDIWLLDADRTTRFTFDPSPDLFPIWSPDGNRIAFSSNRKGHGDLYQKPSSGAGSEELLVESGQDKFASDWSADGRFILYFSLDPQTLPDIWALPLEGDRKPFVFLKTNFAETMAQFSPDGRWVAYMSNESGRFEIYVRPFSGPSSLGAADGRAGGQWQISTAGGINPRWGPGGKELYYIAPDGTLMAGSIAVNGATIEPGRPAALFRTRIYGGGTDVVVGANYDVARDGRFLINTVLDDASSPITLLQNWKPPAK